MKVLVTGAHGQLGSDIVSILKNNHEVDGLSRSELDITNFTLTNRIIQQKKPEVVIHCAAYTKVDQAEKDVDQAFLVNAYGTRNMAVASQEAGAKLVYISTDYVFDGTSSVPYREFDVPNPVNNYGKSKLAGEEFVKNLSYRFFIVRTSWVFGKNGENFMKTMIRLAQNQKELYAVDDQIGSPTYTVDLAHFIEQLISSDKYGVYHASNRGFCSRYDLTKALMEELKAGITVKRAKTASFPTPAIRPAYSVLDHMAIRLNGFRELPHWREGLNSFLQSLK